MLGLSTHTTHRLAPSTRRILPAFAVVAVISISSTLLVYWMGMRVAAANRAVMRNQEIIAGLEDVLSTIKDAETGERGFLLTGDEKYLDPYIASLKHMSTQFRRLEYWTKTGDVDSGLAKTVARLTRDIFDGFSETIAARRRSGFRAALAIVQTNVHMTSMDDLRNQIRIMEDQEKAELVDSLQQRNAATWNRTFVTICSSAVTLLFLIWAFRHIRRAIANLDRQNQLLAVTLASIGDGVIVTDLQDRVTFLNEEAQRLTGWNHQQALHQPLPSVFKIVNELTRQPTKSQMNKMLRLGENIGLADQTLLVAKDGREIPIDESGAPILNNDGTSQGMVRVFRDVTGRRQAEENLHNAVQRLKSHLENSPVAVIEFDTELRITRWTDAAKRTFGWSADEVLGKSMWDVPWICKDDRSRLAGVSANLLNGNQSRTVTPNRNLRKDGSVMWCEWYNSSLHNEHGKLDSIFSVVLDVTERVKAQEAVQQARTVAEAASKAKDHFIAVLSHELRNPLNPVLAAASMLRKDCRFDAETIAQLEIICRNAELEARLIDDLLDITRIERGKVDLDRRPIDLCLIIQQAAEVCMSEIAAKQLDFRMELGNTALWVNGDPARLQQVFWNLIRNAAKFTPAGGSVIVRCQSDDGGQIVTHVIDNGKGIEPDDLSRIFNAFEQAERSITRQFGGLGLGLTISKAMVELHGGRISVYSEGNGKGATFTVHLPLLPAQITGPSIPPIAVAPLASATTRRLRILLVEDHADTARIMRLFLQSQGHQVKVANNVASATELAGEQAFDLLLSDLGLPDGTGLELMRSLRARGSRLPGIALSGYGQEKDVQQSHDAGFMAHLTKPINLSRLTEAIAGIAAEAAPLRSSSLSV